MKIIIPKLNANNFLFYDGTTGKTVLVNSFIPDNKQEMIIDQDDLDIIRLNGEGGADPIEEKRRKEWNQAEKFKKANEITKN